MADTRALRLPHHPLCAAIAAALALKASVVVAEQQVLLEETVDDTSTLPMETITVYATATPLAAIDYPGQVSVITRDVIEAFSPSAMSDLLRDVPGVDFTGGPRRTGETPSIRGLSGENVLVLLDGARQSFLSAHDGRFFIDPELVRTAEVVRGPSSALYGSGAVGGVMAFETVRASDLLNGSEGYGARIRSGYQSVNDEMFSTLTAYARSGDVDLIGSVGVRESGDITLGSGADLPSDDSIDNAMAKLTWSASESLEFDVSWQRFANTAIEPNNGQGTAATGNELQDRDVEKEVVSDTLRAGLRYNPTSDWVDARLTVYQSNSSVDEFDPTTGRRILRDIETNGLSLRNNTYFDFKGLTLTATAGVDWFEDSQVGTDNTAADGNRAGVPNGNSAFTGVFAQLEADIDRPLGLPGSLLLIPTLRVDSFDTETDSGAPDQSDEQWSPRFAASYAPVDSFRAFASYSEGFRAPSINELYLEGVHFAVPHPTLFNPRQGQFVFVNNNFEPNAALTPEISSTVEVGMSLNFDGVIDTGDNLQAKLSTYQSDIEDLINLEVDFAYNASCFQPPFFPCSAGTTRSSNVASAEISGVEAELAYTRDDWYLRATYGTVEGTDNSTGEDVGALFPDRLALDIGFNLSSQNARVGTRIQLAEDFARRELDGNGQLSVVETRASYAVLDLYATWQPAQISGLRIDLGIDNLFDENYERVFAGVSEPGRNLRLAASYQFGQ